MSDFVPGAEPTNLPFSQAILDAEAKNAKEHPEHTDTPFSQTEVGKVIMETEQRNVADFQAGKISQEEFDHLRDVSQHQLDSLKEHLGEDLTELSQKATDWKNETIDEFKDLKESHPEAIADLEHGNPTLANAALVADVAFDRLEPLVNDVVLEGVHQIGDHVMDDLKESASSIVEARADLPSVSDTERSDNSTHLDVALAKLDHDKEAFDHGIEDAENKVHEDFDKLHEAVDASREYGEAHPDAHILDHQQMSDTPEVQHELSAHEDTA